MVDGCIVIADDPKRRANVRVKADVSALLSINSISGADLNRLLVPAMSNESLLYSRD
jgi:hypothetical protein